MVNQLEEKARIFKAFIKGFLATKISIWYRRDKLMKCGKTLSNDPGQVDSNFFCYAATVLSPHRNVLIFTQRMHKPT